EVEAPAGTFTAPIVGVGVDYVSPRGSIVMARPTYQRWWNDRSVNRFHVTLAPGAAVEDVRHAIATTIGGAGGLKVLTQRELYAYHQDAVRRAFRLTRALEILPLVVATLGLAEALLAVSLDRRREFALLRAAGATRTQVLRAVLGESVGVGVLGLAGGVAIGLLLAQLWVRVNFTYQLGWEIEFHFATTSLPAAAAAAIAVSVGAGILPARRVAALPVLEALRATQPAGVRSPAARDRPPGMRGAAPALVVLAAVTACRGVRLEDRTTEPRLPGSALEVVATLDWPPGNVAVSRSGRVFLSL